MSDLRDAYRLYEDCSGSAECLKVKLAAALGRAARASSLSLIGGVTLVARQDRQQERSPLTEDQIEASLPRSLADREEALDDIIQERAARFVDTHSVQINLSDLDFGRALQEEGKRKRTLTTLLMMWLMMAGTILPIKFGTLAILAGKALIISKLALVLVGIVGLKKLLSSGDDHESSYQVVQVPHHGHRRNLEASDIAYRGYASKMANI
ncbi:hypothetical protein AAG570_009398 [Ranatra chinensis]|uniref:Uncharacterized protein n=1 Tax=Ranatra chinensis TaxID=642074 RepID=A0ABD0YP24_9HEMI